MLDWRQLCRGLDGISVDGDRVEVVMADERRQRITIRETAQTFDLIGIVARPAAVDTVPDMPLRAWRRNRAMQLVGFRLDQKNRLVGPRVRVIPDKMPPDFIEEFDILEGEFPTGRSLHESP